MSCFTTFYQRVNNLKNELRDISLIYFSAEDVPSLTALYDEEVKISLKQAEKLEKKLKAIKLNKENSRYSGMVDRLQGL